MVVLALALAMVAAKERSQIIRYTQKCIFLRTLKLKKFSVLEAAAQAAPVSARWHLRPSVGTWCSTLFARPEMGR